MEEFSLVFYSYPLHSQNKHKTKGVYFYLNFMTEKKVSTVFENAKKNLIANIEFTWHFN